MKVNLPASWSSALGDELTRPYFEKLSAFVDGERAAFPDAIFPAEDEVFAALRLTALPEVKVLLLGQDPYFNPGQAHGLCFSVRKHVAVPPSLRNIFQELNADLGAAVPDNGFLAPWAEQGVLMLNTVLTVRSGTPNSHKARGWETFTDAVIQRVNEKPDPVVFVLWGGPARKKKKLIAQHHVIVEGAHPSPLSARSGFFGTRPFSAINRALVAAGKPPIEWQIPNL
jgi:uracil-DNA glycosylase